MHKLPRRQKVITVKKNKGHRSSRTARLNYLLGFFRKLLAVITSYLGLV